MNRNEFRQQRTNLADLAREGRVVCEKHDTLVSLPMLYGKRCYISRNEGSCPYLKIIEHLADA